MLKRYRLQRESATWFKDVVDRIYLDDNYHCCSTDKYELWHVGDCCPHHCGKIRDSFTADLIFCGDFWSSKTLVKHHMKTNRFSDVLEKTGQACCVIEMRTPHLIWGHHKNIYDIAIPAHLSEDIVGGAKALKMYSRSNVVGILTGSKQIA
tara:strand:+ start:433 stop:885 length:453 start_codon:yes stop_codon:yes gene_type:complete